MGVPLMDRLFRRRRASAGVPTAENAVLPDVPAIAAAPPNGGVWSAARVAQAEALWGEGFIAPGGADEIKHLTVPFGLSAAHSFLLVGAGAGGAARAIATGLGAWVSAYEADPHLVDVAARCLERAGTALARRATVAPWDPDMPAFANAAFHHALALDVLGVTRRDPVLAAIVRAVKPGGQVTVVQSIDPTAKDSDAIVPMLNLLGCDLRVVEDQTDRHAQQTLQGWKLLARRLRGTRPSPVQAAVLVAEAEYWLHRLRRIRDGRLKIMRWSAIVT